jgi:lipid-A-disaccharide synthase
MDKEVVTELIQDDFNERRLEEELKLILTEKQRQTIFENYAVLESELGGKGASETAAKLIVGV